MSATLKRKLNTMKWLVKREFWENKGLYLWAPAALAALLLVFWLVTVLRLTNWSDDSLFKGGANSLTAVTAANLLDLFRTFLMPIVWMMSFASVHYLLSALHSESQDRSVLFWKSLPISDWEVVLSKLAFPLVIGPLIAFAVTLIAYLLFVLAMVLAYAIKGSNLFELIFLDANFYLRPLKILSLLPMYALWALPTVGWILMFSARARSRVFPWAYGLPVITWGILLMANFSYKLDWNLIWPTENILVRILGGTLPGTWVLAIGTVDERHNMFLPESLFQQALALSSSVELWLGVTLGIAMIAIAVHLRGRGEASN